MGADHIGHAGAKGRRIVDLAQGDHEAFEIIVVMVVMMVMILIVMVVVMIMIVVVVVMHLAARLQIGFGADALAQQHIDRQRAHGGFDHLHARAAGGFELGGQRLALGLAQKVGFIHHDHIGAGDLILEKLRQRRFMIKVLVHLALCIHGGDVMGKPPLTHRLAVHHGDHAVHRHLRRDFRPVESAHQRLRQGKARGFDHDMVDLALALQKLLHRRDEILGHGAADTAVGKLHHILFGAGLVAAALEDIAIHAQIAELVDDQGDAPPARVLQHMADQCGFARAKKAGDNGCGNFLGHGGLHQCEIWQAREGGPAPRPYLRGRAGRGQGDSRHCAGQARAARPKSAEIRNILWITSPKSPDDGGGR